MGGLERGWSISKSSWTFLRQEPKLLVFPIISASAVLLMLGGSVPVADWVGHHTSFPTLDENTKFYSTMAAMLVVYIVCWFVAVFFNAALIFCVIRQIDTGTTTIREGLLAAASRIPQIFAWSVVAATVGLVLKVGGDVLSKTAGKRLGVIAEIVVAIFAGVLYILWVAATYFVLPALVVEKIGPIAAFRRSLSLIESKWTDVVGGEARFGLLSLIAMVPIFAMIGVWWALGDNASDAVQIALVCIVVIYIAILAIVFSTLGTIFLAAVYKYAISGNVPSLFKSELVQTALRTENVVKNT